ncbi:MAG: TrlF family AAA-like ATPase [Anaerolineae bacterium]
MAADVNAVPAPSYQGAQWTRVDLHLHTPGCHTFHLPNGLDPERDRDQLVAMIVAQMVKQGIEIAAITDYQTVHSEWYVPIRDQARMEGIVVYPGAELSYASGRHGFHLLAVFPLTATPEEIRNGVQALHRTPSETLAYHRQPHLDIVGDPLSSRTRLCDGGDAVVIAAHPHEDNGLLKTFALQIAADHARSIPLDALEDLDERDRARFVSTGLFTPEQARQLASVEFSDPKRIEEIGNKARPDGTPRATYLKLSVRDSLGAVCLALHDPEVMVRVGAKPVCGHTRVESLVIEGNGFLSGVGLAFSSELNVLVGGRGVGKSAVLEAIRYVLDLPSYSPTDYREHLIEHALGSGGRATLWLEQAVGPGLRRRYRFQRVLGEAPRVFELDPEREVRLSPLDILGDRETPLFFGQREIYDVTNNSRQMLRLLDEMIGRPAEARSTEVTKLETVLRDNARAAMETRRRLRDREEIAQRLREIAHEMEVYERRGIAQKLVEATALTADEERLRRAIALTDATRAQLQEAGADVVGRLESMAGELRAGISSERAILLEAADVLHDLCESLRRALSEADIASMAAASRLVAAESRWQDARRPIDEAIRQVKQELGSQSLDPDRLIGLAEERAQLEPKLRALEALETAERALLEERFRLIGRLRDARHAAWVLRSEEATRLSARLAGRVRVDVEYRGQRSAFAERLAGLCQGSGFDRRSCQKLAEASEDGYALAEVIRKGPAGISEAFDLSTARAQQLHSYLAQGEERLFELELMVPQDMVEVSLKLGERYVSLDKLSAGQRATAMLLLLLVQEDRPLFVDQPEDDLDNRFIYDDIVRILRQQKGVRQLIVATHNPNIPVLGNAELLVALNATDGRAGVEAQGGIDASAIREVIKRVMEGGEDAFRRRASKYGLALGNAHG